MGVAVQQPETLNLEQIQAFLDGCQSVTFEPDSRAAKYAVVNAVLRRHHYAGQTRAVKGLVRRFLGKLSGLSRAQLTRLIGQFLRERTVQPTVYRRRRFTDKFWRSHDVAPYVLRHAENPASLVVSR